MKTEIITELEVFHTKLEELAKKAQGEFYENLKQLFVDHPELNEIEMRINNHEFNDGDPTKFSLYYEDLSVTDKDGNEYERESYGESSEKSQNQPLIKAVYELFATYDVGDLYEHAFGHEWGGLRITRDYVDTL